MNFYGDHLGAKYKPNKNVENSENVYDNYGIPKESSKRKENAISNYENTKIKFVQPSTSRFSENKTEDKAKVSNKIKKPLVLKIFIFLLTFLTVAGSYGLIVKIIHDYKQDNQSINKLITIINEQNKTLNNLQLQQNKNINNINKINGSVENFSTKGYILSDDNWIIPFNGYQYKFIQQSQIWDSARSYCQSYGADLASLGFQSLHIRKVIRDAIQYTGSVWVGLSDLSSEGTWRWLSSTGSWNGDHATSDISLWYHNSPTSYSSSYDCAVLYASSAYVYPNYCSYGYYFLCEKQM